MSLKNTYVIEKSNVLNELKGTNMSLQELRFFSIYLAKINARDVSTRCVCFPISDFQKIMGFGRLNIKQIQESTNRLLCKVINLPNNRGGYTGFTLFKRVNVFKNELDEWFLEIDASDDALPLFFNLKGNYFTYKLWNALRLTSANQLRMYELLKQHENLGTFEINVSELRELLCIAPNQYTQLVRFKIRVLDSCQKALAENTDICYTYERGKVGNRGKWLTIIFHISKNTAYKDPIQLDDFIKKQPIPKIQDKPDFNPESLERLPVSPASSSRQLYLSGVFEKDLAPDDIKSLCDVLSCKVSNASERTSELLEKRLRVLYGQMLLKSKTPVKNPVTYLLSCINNLDSDNLPSISTKDDIFNIDMYKQFINDFEVI